MSKSKGECTCLTVGHQIYMDGCPIHEPKRNGIAQAMHDKVVQRQRIAELEAENERLRDELRKQIRSSGVVFDTDLFAAPDPNDPDADPFATRRE